MSRVFSIRTVLRQTPNRLVRQFLERLGHADLAIDWDPLGDREIEPVVRALAALTPAQFDRVEGGLHTVFDLACGTGITAVVEVAGGLDDADLLAELSREAGLYEQAMWVWLNRLELTEQAALVHQIDHFTWWRRRDDLPRREPDPSPDALARLGRELSALLEAEQGRGRNCTVEPFTRRGTAYYFAYPDDFVQNVTAHDEHGRLAARTFRRTFSVVFAFDPAAGSLELYAKLPPRIKLRAEVLFARTVLGAELGEWRPDPNYEPNVLKDRPLPLDTDPADHVSVSVRRLRLALANSDREITLTGDPEVPNDACRMLGEVLDRERVPASSVNITLATLCFEFHAVGRRRAGAVTFDVAFPNSCGLRNQRPDRVAVITKYLTRWGIHVNRPARPDLAQAG